MITCFTYFLSNIYKKCVSVCFFKIYTKQHGLIIYIAKTQRTSFSWCLLNGFSTFYCIFVSCTSYSIPSITTPFNVCTFYKPRLALESFAGGADFMGCANFSAVPGRNGCTKTKILVEYPGDHLQMWLPDYFIEVTKHIGRSVFAESLIDGKALKLQLGIATTWWGFSTGFPVIPSASNGSQSPSARDSFWQARILTVPYGNLASSYPPLAKIKGVDVPVCYSAISEFFPAQWNENLSDALYAAAWAPVGSLLCLTKAGALVSGAIAEAKSNITSISVGAGSAPTNPIPCALPVGAKDGFAKNALPSSDVFTPITSGDITKLCMGSWGNLIPRTGWISSEDPHMSAMLAAYKFMSLAGDFNLNADLKLRSDDKWQIVYPPRIGGRCFVPGSPLKDLPLPAADDPFSRSVDELDPKSSLKNHTYIIAVWRKRESCEEPLFGGWSLKHKANYVKNLGVCQAVWGK